MKGKCGCCNQEKQLVYCEECMQIETDLHEKYRKAVKRLRNKSEWNEMLKCQKCGEPFINSIDSITKKPSKYLWKPNCKCLSKGFIVSKG